MSHCAIQQQNAFPACEEMKKRSGSSVCLSPVVSSDRRDPVVCPKPRRVGLVNASIDPMRPLRWHCSHQGDLCDSKAGTDLLDIILSKGGYGGEHNCTQIASSPPPFFSGSPPSRVANPLILDARFGNEKLAPASPPPPPIATASSRSSSPSQSGRKGGCSRANFGDKPAVRIEGFDCRIERDNRRNCSIPALA